jgi:hypothetical protein
MAIVLTVWGFAAEARALIWHLRHGMYVEGAGLRVRTPLSWNVIAGPDAINLINLPGPVRSKLHSAGGVILISNKVRRDKATTLDTIRQRLSKLGARELGSRTVQVGGSPLPCAEFEGFQQGVQVWCLREDTNLTAEFNGSTELVPTFYSLLESAQLH